jgi:hypothetical protein
VDDSSTVSAHLFRKKDAWQTKGSCLFIFLFFSFLS